VSIVLFPVHINAQLFRLQLQSFIELFLCLSISNIQHLQQVGQLVTEHCEASYTSSCEERSFADQTVDGEDVPMRSR
jgi:hypothetical protein